MVNRLLHVGVQYDKHDGGDRQSQEDEGEDEEGGLFARLFGWLSNAKGIDEGVGEEVDKAHTSIMLRRVMGWNVESNG